MRESAAWLFGVTASILACGSAAPALRNRVEDTPLALKDEVHRLPGAVPFRSRQFSGFLDGGGRDRIHYWFVESEGDPLIDPLVLWLNGGPGSSSVLGYLTEFGPYIIDAKGGVHSNPYTWVRAASIIFLEAPAGVGFSYCGGNISAACYANDDSTSTGSLLALRDFLGRFPKFKGHTFMIWGESYAGVYVSTLSKRIVQAHPPLPIEFLGFAAGDPCVSDRYQNLDMHPDIAFHTGLIDEKLHSILTNEQCKEPSVYDGLIPKISGRQRCSAAWRKFDLATSGLSPSMPGSGKDFGFLDSYDTGSYIGSMDPYSHAMIAYLNRADVKKALHVDLGGIFKEASDIDTLRYETQYRACPDMRNNTALQHNSSMLPLFVELVASGHTVLLYSGDADPSVHWTGSDRAIRALNLPEVPGGGWRPWFYDEKPVPIALLAVKAPEWGPQLSAAPRRDGGPVLGGYVVDFAISGNRGSLTFTTLRDAGHMIAQFRPHAALHLFERTVRSAAARRGSAPRLSPLLPETNVSDQDFYSGKGVARRWLIEAQDYALSDLNSVPQGSAWEQLAVEEQVSGPSALFASLIIMAAPAAAVVSYRALVHLGYGAPQHRLQEQLL